MEQLIADFNRITSLTVSNPTPFDLRLEDGGVVTYSYIPRDCIIGEIKGDPSYIWELDHSDYMIVAEEYVLDMSRSQLPRSILTMVREENASTNMGNCTIVSCDGPRFFLQATTNIVATSELVYYTLGHMYI